MLAAAPHLWKRMGVLASFAVWFLSLAAAVRRRIRVGPLLSSFLWFSRLEDLDVPGSWICLRSRWTSLLRSCRLSLDEEDPDWRRRAIRSHSCITLFYVVHLIRFTVPRVLGIHENYLWGDTIPAYGSSDDFLRACAVLVLHQVICYRLTLAVLAYKGCDGMLRILSEAEHEPRASIRRQKQQMLRTVLWNTCFARFWFMIATSAIVIGMLVINLLKSDSVLEMLCWFCWWLVDLSMVFAGTVDMIVLPATAIVPAADYRIDLLAAADELNLMASSLIMMTERDFYRVEKLVDLLTAKAVAVHRSTAAILWFLILFTTPIVCFGFFISFYADYCASSFPSPRLAWRLPRSL